ncbi:MAG: hypothetical protein IJO69_00640 [Ruminiclostridium sp.]|nr:hypothetical protein [Ruminiclostridium sp.]
MKKLFLLLSLLLCLSACGQQTTTWDTIPQVEVDGTTYLVSSYLWGENQLPEGFILAGTFEDGEFAGSEYFTHPDNPLWVYVRHQDTYQRYVDEAIRGKDYICYHDQLYVSLWSATYYGDHPDMTEEEYEAAREPYNVRIEADTVPGYASLGMAEFSGYETIPTGALSCNILPEEVYANPEEPQYLLFPTVWYTHTDQEEEETRHTGFNVYVLLNNEDGPAAQ